MFGVCIVVNLLQKFLLRLFRLENGLQLLVIRLHLADSVGDDKCVRLGVLLLELDPDLKGYNRLVQSFRLITHIRDEEGYISNHYYQ